MTEQHKDLLKKAKDAIAAVHRAFGAPGDHGYGTPEGDALFELYKVAAEIKALGGLTDGN